MPAKPQRDSDTQKKLWLDFAVPRITLYHGAATVASLQAMAYLGISQSAKELARDTEKFESLDEPPEQLRNYIEMRRLMHLLQKDSAKAAADAAALVYAHAILDAVIFKLCVLSVSLDPSAWATEIQRRQIKFSELQSNTTDEVQKKLLEQHLSQLERESLPHKCDTIFRVMKPSAVRGVLKGFKYSRERLVSLDLLRHDLVHKLMFHRKIRQAQAKVNYLFHTGHFFLNLVSRSHGLSPDALAVSNGAKGPVEVGKRGRA
jgi:hypothetical protein